MKQVINGKRYDTEKMARIYNSGRDGAGVGRETEIYITPKSRTIVRVNLTYWNKEKDTMETLTLSELMEQYPDCAEWLPEDVLSNIPAAE
jgi:hypothetical protein